ncbi:MAG TPA: hypothetical protein VHO01_02450 [Jatrophihabitans sp.]|nr:hypothetical protein [Jatrophihabitans sp.]
METTASLTRVPSEDALRTGLVGELRTTLGTDYSPDELAQSVERAMLDLRGSVAQEALPEMAIRLARHRLAARQHF